MARLEAPPVRYAEAEDGVRVAYGAYGTGAPLLYLHSPLNGHFADGLANPLMRPWYDRFISRNRVVFLDHRGGGLSQPWTELPSMAGYVADIEAVLDDLRVAQLDLFANTSSACWVASTFAAKCPHRVRRLVLFQPTPTGEGTTRDMLAGLQLAEANWELWTETLINQAHGWAVPSDLVREMAEQWRATESLEHVRAVMTWAAAVDVTDTLAAVTVPTLVLTREQATAFTLRAPTNRAAQLIPGATLVTVPGDTYHPRLDHPDESFAEIARFLGLGTDGQRLTDGNAPEGCELTARERKVLALIAAGKTNPEIAEALTIAPATASRHVHNILGKLGMSRRSEAAAWWASNGNGRGEYP